MIDAPRGGGMGRSGMSGRIRSAWLTAKAPLRIAAGIGLIVLGILGLILPVLPGWVFLLPGVVYG